MCHNQKVQCEQETYIQNRLFTAKENEDLKQIAYVKYTSNEFEELSQILGEFMFVDNCKSQ